MRTALVTGAAGFVGSRLIERLSAAGYRVRALARFGTRFPQTTARYEIVRGDVTDEAAVQAAVAGCQLVFHCATGGGGLAAARRIHVEGSHNVVKAAARAGVDRVVHVSTAAAHEPARVLTEAVPLRRAGGPYALSKAEAERVVGQAAEKLGVSLAIVRPTVVYGPGSRNWTLALVERLRSERILLGDGGRGSLNLIYIDDLVAGILLAGTHACAAGEAFLLSGAQPGTWAVYIGLLAAECGRPRPPSLPLWRARLFVHWSRWHFRFTRRPRRLDEVDLALMMERSEVRIDKARRLLGFEPKVTLADGVRRTAAWLRQEGHLSSRVSAVGGTPVRSHPVPIQPRCEVVGQ